MHLTLLTPSNHGWLPHSRIANSMNRTSVSVYRCGELAGQASSEVLTKSFEIVGIPYVRKSANWTDFMNMNGNSTSASALKICWAVVMDIEDKGTFSSLERAWTEEQRR